MKGVALLLLLATASASPASERPGQHGQQGHMPTGIMNLRNPDEMAQHHNAPPRPHPNGPPPPPPAPAVAEPETLVGDDEVSSLVTGVKEFFAAHDKQFHALFSDDSQSGSPPVSSPSLLSAQEEPMLIPVASIELTLTSAPRVVAPEDIWVAAVENTQEACAVEFVNLCGPALDVSGLEGVEFQTDLGEMREFYEDTTSSESPTPKFRVWDDDVSDFVAEQEDDDWSTPFLVAWRRLLGGGEARHGARHHRRHRRRLQAPHHDHDHDHGHHHDHHDHDHGHHHDHHDHGHGGPSSAPHKTCGGPLGFGSREADQCLRNNKESLSFACQQAIEDTEAIFRSLTAQDQHGPPPPPPPADVATFLVGLLLVTASAYLCCRRRRHRRRVRQLLDVLGENPELKTAVEDAAGTSVPVAGWKCKMLAAIHANPDLEAALIQAGAELPTDHGRQKKRGGRRGARGCCKCLLAGVCGLLVGLCSLTLISVLCDTMTAQPADEGQVGFGPEPEDATVGQDGQDDGEDVLAAMLFVVFFALSVLIGLTLLGRACGVICRTLCSSSTDESSASDDEISSTTTPLFEDDYSVNQPAEEHLTIYSGLPVEDPTVPSAPAPPTVPPPPIQERNFDYAPLPAFEVTTTVRM